MKQGEQERFDRRRWLDFVDLPADIVGVNVRVGNRSRLAQPDGEAMTLHVVEFLERAGIRCQAAQPVGVGSSTGGIVGDIFDFMKPIGISIQLVKFALAWHARVASRKRHGLLPPAMVILLADHIDPKQIGAEQWEDMATWLVAVLPDLQKDLEAEYPSCSFRFEVRARGAKVQDFYLRTGASLPITDKNTLKILEHLDRESAELSLLHCEGWFALPQVVQATIGLRYRNLQITDPRPPAG
ncbi:hypothetical protein AB0N65_17630 [Paenarthrobacter sp. NPDC089322]|uniref:hypothetical protein n=1 Tax=Paenarthrobacter sp. NPDC089322 TaxID=3155065 RepID=UPI00344A6E63